MSKNEKSKNSIIKKAKKLERQGKYKKALKICDEFLDNNSIEEKLIITKIDLLNDIYFSKKFLDEINNYKTNLDKFLEIDEKEEILKIYNTLDNYLKLNSKYLENQKNMAKYLSGGILIENIETILVLDEFIIELKSKKEIANPKNQNIKMPQDLREFINTVKKTSYQYLDLAMGNSKDKIAKSNFNLEEIRKKIQNYLPQNEINNTEESKTKNNTNNEETKTSNENKETKTLNNEETKTSNENKETDELSKALINTYNENKIKLEENPNNPELLKLQADNLLLMGKYKEALESINKSIELNPNDGDSWRIKGDLHKYGHYDYSEKEAINAYNKSIEIDPNNAEALSELGDIFLDLKEFDLSLKFANKALKINPKIAMALSIKGYCLINSEEYQEGIDSLNQAIEIRENNEVDFEAKAYAHIKLNETDEALKTYSQLLEINPSNINGIIGEGIIYSQNGELNKALKQYNKAIILEPENIQIFKDKIQILNQMNRYEEALKTQAKLVKLSRKTQISDYDFEKDLKILDPDQKTLFDYKNTE